MTKNYFLVLFWINVVSGIVNVLFFIMSFIFGNPSFINFFASLMSVGGAMASHLMIKEIENE